MKNLIYGTVLALAVGLSACASDEDPTGPAPVPIVATPQTNIGENWPNVKSYCDPEVPGVRIYVSEIQSLDPNNYQAAAGGGVSVIQDGVNC